MARPISLSLLGTALVSPVPVLAGDPALTPAWALDRIAGIPGLSLLMLACMGGLVGVAMLCLTKIDGQGN